MIFHAVFTTLMIMKLDQNPVFRKIIVPWYDSENACLTSMGFLAAVAIFGAFGLPVAREDPAYAAAAWVPGLLVVLSAATFASMGIRLLLRRSAQRSSR
ncbi:MAG: hypothetical protein LJE63_02720 [Desulfobacteraceae bacterium]|nr:hypothetical protein [Desulfobacteraceae bacterium]